jgi:acylphosphatase
MENELERLHIMVSGNVQGVSFRWWVQKKAQELHLGGWIKNLDDGRVEVVFEGEKEKINKMLETCKKGSKSSKVTSIDVELEEATGKMIDFKILY